MNKQNEVLEWKNHEQWFKDLNYNLQSTRLELESMLLDIRNIQTVYTKIKILKSSYIGYLGTNSKIINDKLTKIEEIIRSKEFILSLEKYRLLKEEKKKQFETLVWKNFDELLSVFELINNCLKDYELTPKSIKIIKSDPNNAIFGG